jgi:hypothetical protein
VDVPDDDELDPDGDEVEPHAAIPAAIMAPAASRPDRLT